MYPVIFGQNVMVQIEQYRVSPWDRVCEDPHRIHLFEYWGTLTNLTR
jgi:hypothetical protein